MILLLLIIGIIIGFIAGRLNRKRSIVYKRAKRLAEFKAGKVKEEKRKAHEEWLLKNPPPKKCTAVLCSGDHCIYVENHPGAHEVHVGVFVSMEYNHMGFQTSTNHYEDYCWEDPTNGVHSRGFFIEGNRRVLKKIDKD